MSENQTEGKIPPPTRPTGNGRTVLGDIKPTELKSTNKSTNSKKK